jgi:hypothetical protein
MLRFVTGVASTGIPQMQAEPAIPLSKMRGLLEATATGVLHASSTSRRLRCPNDHYRFVVWSML